MQHLFERLCSPERIAVYYLEVYGKNIGGGARNYTKQGKVAFRLIDVVFINNFEELLAWPADHIARWRDNGGQQYVEATRLAELAKEAGFEPVPALFDLDAAQLPTSLESTHRFLLSFERSLCTLDDGAEGVPEGVVVRSPDRKSIAKIRREDYERTLKRRKK
jgi:hypothetical protein